MLNLEINDQFAAALDLLENSRANLFITGKAGTGKSTLLQYFREKSQKRVAVLAPTGVAALNVRGETIHSFCRFKPDVTLARVKKLRFKKEGQNLYRRLDTIIIDEISMVRSDLLDCVDKFLRLNGPEKELPFGGIQMVFIGDLYQLPPVLPSGEKKLFRGHYRSEYFFDAKAFPLLNMRYLELEKVYRQNDPDFIRILNTIRNNSAGEKELAELNRRVLPLSTKEGEGYVTLTPFNKSADAINQRRLGQLPGETVEFSGELSGDFDPRQLPTALKLQLKPGAQVMMLNNDSGGRWVNGSLGTITEIYGETIQVAIRGGGKHEVEPHTWEMFHYHLGKGDKLESEVLGSFTQYPLKLAWAVTIHKSQGKTFDQVVIDLGRGAFAHGQTYVALSRCRTLQGLILSRPVKKSDLLTDYRIVNFVTSYQYRQAEKKLSLDKKIALIQGAIERGETLDLVYLKRSDEKSRRSIRPREVGEMFYQEKMFLGVRAHCLQRNAERVFRVDRILEIDPS